MERTHIKKLYKGRIPIRDIIVNRALQNGGVLEVRVKDIDTVYVLEERKLKSPAYSTEVFDNFSNVKQRLLYFTPPVKDIEETVKDTKQKDLFTSN